MEIYVPFAHVSFESWVFFYKYLSSAVTTFFAGIFEKNDLFLLVSGKTS